MEKRFFIEGTDGKMYCSDNLIKLESEQQLKDVLKEWDGESEPETAKIKLDGTKLNWIWYLAHTEGACSGGLVAYGLVKGYEDEFGCVSFNDLVTAGAYIVRGFEETKFEDIMNE